MSAFFAKLLDLLIKYATKYFVTYVLDFVQAYIERRNAREQQKKKDEANIQKTREAIKNDMSKEEIVKRTEDMLNG